MYTFKAYINKFYDIDPDSMSDVNESYLIEKRTHEGYKYESNVANALKTVGWVKPGYVPAGAASDRPDLDIFINGREYGVELKKLPTSSGGLVIHYNGPQKGYSLGSHGNHEEKKFLHDIAENNNVIGKIKQTWRDRPFIQRNKDQEWVDRVTASGLSLKERYDHDVKNFKDIYFELPKDSISRYYNIKSTYYINIGTHGFYLLGNSDPAGFNRVSSPKVPLWDDNHKVVLRIRMQSKGVTKAQKQEERSGWPHTGGQGYQITMEMQFRSVRSSPYNIGPISSRTSVNVNPDSLILPDIP